MAVDTVPDFVPQLPVLTLTWPSVRKLLIEATETLTGYGRGKVIVETINDIRPPDGGPYASLWFNRLEPLSVNVGDFYYETTTDPTADKSVDAIQVLDNESFCSVRFSFWGPSAFTEATQFMQTLHAARRFQDLWKIIGFAGIDAVQDVTIAYGGQVQQRAFFNMDFYVCLGRALPADWFDTSQWEIQLPTVIQPGTEDEDYLEQLNLSKGIIDGPPCDMS